MELTGGKEVIAVEDEEATALSLMEIYNNVVSNGEIIVTIPEEEEEALRKGLASVKAKQNAKLKDAGLPTDKSTLSYTVTKSKEHEAAIDVHILLSKKAAITVISMKLPDPSI